MEMKSAMKESKLEGQTIAPPARALRLETNVAVLVIGERLQFFRKVGRLLIGFGRQLSRSLRDIVELERMRVQWNAGAQRANDECERKEQAGWMGCNAGCHNQNHIYDWACAAKLRKLLSSNDDRTYPNKK